MSVTDTILADADAALTAALAVEPRARLDAMTRFMHAFERLAREVAAGAATWDEARSWATTRAPRLRAAREALTDWELELGQIFYHGGEEAALRALMRRSQHALARALFRGTPADELLAGYEADDVDADLRDEAERLALDGPRWLPSTHTWWRWQRAD